ncbi:MAG: TRAP transporter permease [Syntrophaceae bacterium]|nr:TRAP transporter permease [Syntrophaceae bacterium]
MNVLGKVESGKASLESLIIFLSVLLMVFHIATAGLVIIPSFLQRGIHLAFVLFLSFLLLPLRKTGRGTVSALDWVLAILSLGAGLYVIVFWKEILFRQGMVTPLETAVGWVLILLVLEQARRATGNVLAIIAAIATLYPLLGQHIPGLLGHRGYGFDRVASQMALSLEGIFGTPLGVSAEYIVLFIFLSSLLSQCGMGEFLLKMALSITGRFSGGPAKTAVIMSSLFGTISGSAVANVVGTGTFTIPMMIRQGFPPHMAGAVEAVASTGGQIMPPIMGAAAFIMAQILGMSYVTVMGAAVIPAILYYLSVFMGVHLYAVKIGMRPSRGAEIPPFFKTLKEGLHFLVPLLLLLFLLVVVRYTVTKSVLWAIAATFVVTWPNREHRLTWAKIQDACLDAAKNVLTVAGACAAAGVVVGSITMTGIGFKLFSLVMGFSGGILLIALIFTMVAATIMGMGVPTTAAYIIVAITCAPMLIDFGVSPLGAHMFVFYFAILSAITPPVALAAFAASGLAKESPMKIGWTAVGLAASTYIVPFAFVYNTGLLGAALPGQVLQVTFTAMIGITAVAAAWTAFLFAPLKITERMLLALGGVLVIVPEIYTDLLGLVLVGFVAAGSWRKRKKTSSSTGMIFDSHGRDR